MLYAIYLSQVKIVINQELFYTLSGKKLMLEQCGSAALHRIADQVAF
jgi:hypothetical protein